MAITRRAFLLGGAGAVAAAGVTGTAVGWDRIEHRIDEWRHPVPEPPHPVPSVEPGALVSGSFVSPARDGATVGWSVSYPPGQPTDARLPLTIALYGKGGDHTTAFDSRQLGVFLAAAVESGLPAFAIASVDGGADSYWHARESGDDPQRMILEEFLPRMAARGLLTDRIGLLGWSMGGYGALLLGERLGSAGCFAIVADSPALWTDAASTAPGAFDDAADYERNDVFAGRDRLAGIPLRVTIGTSDSFYAATKTFVGGLSEQPQTDFGPGGHDDAFWLHVTPADLRFLGHHLPGSPS